jgi:phenylpropionate dioxygenase-like ring-hydroxylating dioxygenase large terminal subunit
MGANLGVTGRVVGNDIACPFHGWQFSGEGACTHIPYATTDKVPSFVKTKAWHCVETNGSIMIWHDAEGRPPLWMVPDLKEINTGRYKSHGSTLHRVRAHIQEIPENGPDTAHLNHLHLPIGVRLLSAFGFHHGWDATWEAGTGLDEHLVCQSISLSHTHTHNPYDDKVTDLFTPHADLHGRERVGSVSRHLRPGQPHRRRHCAGWTWHRPPAVCNALRQSHVDPNCHAHSAFAATSGPPGFRRYVSLFPPQSHFRQLIVCRMRVIIEWTVPRFFAKFVMRSSVAQFERDVPLWNNKVFLDQPMLIKEVRNPKNLLL